MKHVSSVIFRAAGVCNRSQSWTTPCYAVLRPFTGVTIQTGTGNSTNLRHEKLPVPTYRRTSFPTTSYRTFSTSSIVQALRQSNPQLEHGLAFRKTPLSSRELQAVYGKFAPPPQFANRLLRVLHERRVDGTLDLPMPADMQQNLRRYPHAIDSALYWLRSNHVVDEDAAIMARIEREESGQEQDDPSSLMQRGQHVGLYGLRRGTNNDVNYDVAASRVDEDYRGPQSGQYQAKLSEKGDVFGRSELERIRAENEAKAVREEEELEKQISQITEKEMDKRSQNTSLANRPEQGLEAAQDSIRPPNEFDKWVLRAKNRSTSQLTMDSPEVKDRSAVSRLVPSFLLMMASGWAFYLLVQSWRPPTRSERLMPDMALSFATVCGILGANLAVFLLWRFPPAWPLMNRYFLMVPVTVKPLSLIGSIFSHTARNHLLINAIPLLVFGPSLHEELGRAQFLACYVLSGIFGNYVSLLYSVGTRMWITTSLGASGSVWGIMAAYCCLHANDRFTIVFIPQEWKDTIQIKGWMFFVGLIGADLFNLLVRQNKSINYLAHFGGAAAGWVFATLWRNEQAPLRGSGAYTPKPTRPWWEFIYKGAGNPGKES